ncbi:MAG: permease [Candidatus Dormibacteria bacterium]
MFWETLWALVLGFGLSGALQAFVPRRALRRWLGGSGPVALLRATGLGAASSSCSYAAAAMAKSLFSQGAGFVAAMVFMFASTNLVIELGIVLAVLIGWQFTASEVFGGLLMIVLFALAARFTLSPAIVESARARLQGGVAPAGPAGASTADTSWRESLRSGARWRAAAGYGFADLRMLRKEIAIGFLAAGFLAALVPASAWRVVFLGGHGIGPSVENAAIGPLIAMLSFVCSVGNVPLAAAFWKGGISFGGVASFIYADLLTLPLVLIYRKYYGIRLTLRLVLTFWLVMSAAGLTTQYLFQALGAIPSTRPHQIALHALGWNLTSGLDGLALLLLVGGFVLQRRHQPSSGADGFATDPVCGMQVERATAPVTLPHQGELLYFCSDRCRDRFERDPGRFGALGSGIVEHDAEVPAIDPVCGMAVGPRPAAELEHEGRRFGFCSTACRDRFAAQPLRYLGHDQRVPSAVDPVCGMEVEPDAAAADIEHGGQHYYFCSSSCADRFRQHPDRFGELRTLEIPRGGPDLPIDPICGMAVDPEDPGATLELPEGTVYFCCQPCADQYAASRAGA